MPISCHFRGCRPKALLVTSLTHVSGAIASVQTFSFYTGELEGHWRRAYVEWLKAGAGKRDGHDAAVVHRNSVTDGTRTGDDDV